jgi:predicted O-methyltransferase YrrM
MLLNKLKQKIKYLTESFYKFIYVRFFLNENHIYKEETSKFKKLKFNEKKSEENLNKIINNIIGRDYNSDLDSVHWKLFSAISLETKKYNKILEIGTYDGQFTSFLSKMFPNSLITTVDLPKDDPLLKKFYDRSTSENYDKYINKQKKNTDHKNIKTLKTNTFFLNESLELNEKFDLIWVDGGHLYPEVAWDLCMAYNLLNKGGFLLCDDVIFTEKEYKSDYVSNESSHVLNYLEERIDNSFVHFLKRTDLKRYALKYSRKYVSILRK